MTVRAVTPLVPSAHGHVQMWRDADGYDLEQDSRWDEIDPGYYGTDPKLEEFNSPRGSNGRPALGQRRVASPMHGAAGTKGGRHALPAAPTSSTRAGAGVGAGRSSGASLAAGSLDTNSVSPAALEPSSGVLPGSEPSREMSSARRSPGAA